MTPSTDRLPDSAPDALARCRDRWFCVILICGGLLRLAMIFEPFKTSDMGRFDAEARSLLAGKGFGLEAETAAQIFGIDHDVLVTEHPPGYPVFIALQYLVWENRRGLLVSNWLMSTASLLFLYRALRSVPGPAALVATALMAFNPWLVRWTGALLSETLGVFLCSILVYLIAVFERKPSALCTGMIGLLCMALPLTMPGALFMCGLIVLAAAWRLRKQAVRLAALACGVLLLLVPWQIHCLEATGRIQPLMFTAPRGSIGVTSFGTWVNSWMSGTAQIHVYWLPDFFDRLPDDVFKDAEERQQLYDTFAKRRARQIDPEEFQQVFDSAVKRRQSEVPWVKRAVWLPLSRSNTLWTQVQGLIWRPSWMGRLVDIKELDYDSRRSFGWKPEWLGDAADIGLFLIHWFYLIVYVYLMVAALRSRQLMAWAIVCGIVLYTLCSGYLGVGEFRRNFTFYPAILFLFYYWPYWPARERDYQPILQGAHLQAG